MKQFLKRFRIPLIVVGVLCLLSATALITHRAYAVKSAQDEGKSTQSPQTDGGAQTAQEDNGAQTQQTESTLPPEIDAAEAVSFFEIRAANVLGITSGRGRTQITSR